MAKKWTVSDWHCGENRFDIMNRPFKSAEEHVKVLLERHNSLVAPDDEVINLGDVCYQNAPEYLPWVKHFNGRKILIRGNHDRVFSDAELREYFVDTIPEGEGIELDLGFPAFATHYPSCGRPDRFNIVGHIHSAWKTQLNMLNVGVDVNHFYPTDLDKIGFYYQAISDFYDEDVWVAYNAINAAYRGKRGKPSTYFQPKDQLK